MVNVGKSDVRSLSDEVPKVRYQANHNFVWGTVFIRHSPTTVACASGVMMITQLFLGSGRIELMLPNPRVNVRTLLLKEVGI